jgi:hypothetical protein
MAASIAGFRPTSGLALDWSKCYDHLLLDLLDRVGQRVKIPPALLRPMLAAYRQPRAILLAGALAKEKRPTAGLAPGCPRATDLLAIVVYMYTSNMADIHPGIVSRPYVDDSTSDITDQCPETAVEIVSGTVDFTNRFAADMAFVPNHVKSRRFSTDSTIRAALRGLPGPEVAMSFLDLGIAQTPVNRPSPLQGKRVTAGLGKLWRTSVLSLSLKRKCHFVAASGIPASMYGVASAPLSNRTLHALASAALDALWRSTARCASELVFELFVPCRADPTAVSVTAPLLALGSVLLTGTLPMEDLHLIWDFPHAAGPIRACKDAVKRSGTLFNAAALTLSAHGKVLPLVTTPASTIRSHLLHGLSALRLTRLASRRPGFAYLREGIDRVATSAYESTTAPESRKAALRVVQTGGTFTQSVASRWIAGGSLCPFCRLGKEDPCHRYWTCPRWYQTRMATLGPHTRTMLEAIVGRPSLTSGVFPTDHALVAAQCAAEGAGHWPLPVVLPLEVWTDGSCTYPRDPLLRRAAWAVVGGPPCYPTLGSAMVIGRQTIGRAELSALIWVSMCGGATAIIDAQYLIGCMARCAGVQPTAALLDSKNGDLWRLLLRPFPVRWVKAHLTCAQAVLAGVSERDRLGNDAADVAGSTLAVSNNPYQDLVDSRSAHLSAALVIQSVLARIQEAALEAHHAPPFHHCQAQVERSATHVADPQGGSQATAPTAGHPPAHRAHRDPCSGYRLRPGSRRAHWEQGRQLEALLHLLCQVCTGYRALGGLRPLRLRKLLGRGPLRTACCPARPLPWCPGLGLPALPPPGRTRQRSLRCIGLVPFARGPPLVWATLSASPLAAAGQRCHHCCLAPR